MTDTARTPESHPTTEPVAFDERTRRVLELRKQVREGTYRPDPEEVAGAMLREWAANVRDSVPEASTTAAATSADRRALSERFVVPKSAPVWEENSAILSA